MLARRLDLFFPVGLGVMAVAPVLVQFPDESP